MYFGANLLAFRENKFKTQPALAKALQPLLPEYEVNKQLISKWEKRKDSPSKDVEVAVAKLMDVDPVDLVFSDLSQKGTRVKEPTAADSKLIPLYDVIAAGGTKMNSEMEGVSEPAEYIYAGTLFSDAVAAVKVYGDSMWPEYPHGSMVACREVVDRDLILWGQIYVIETSEFRIVKRVQRGEEKGYIMAESKNTVKNNKGKEIHETLDIPLAKVRRLFLVIGRADRVQA